MSVNERIELLLSLSRSFFVIDSTGILQHYEAFIEEGQDPDLYAGLFAAVNVYAKELDAGKIQTATLEEHKFVFAEDDDSGYLIVMDVDTQMSDEHGTWLVHQILIRFKDIQSLKADDIKGTLSLETLFSERGKEINWNTIQAIRESAIQTVKESTDNIETLNMSKVNLRNKFWVRVRKMVSAMVQNQKTLTGALLIIRNNNELNKLYSGREGFEKVGKLYNYLQSKFDEGLVGMELETELIQIDNLYCSIFTLFSVQGGLLAVASPDSITITRLTTQIERLVSSIERLSTNA